MLKADDTEQESDQLLGQGLYPGDRGELSLDTRRVWCRRAGSSALGHPCPVHLLGGF